MTKNLGEHGDKIDEATKTEIQSAIDASKGLESSVDAEAIKAQSKVLSEAAMKIGQAMYKKDGAADAGAAKTEGDAKNAEYEEKK